MSYNIDDIEKILNFTSWSNKRKIDTLFEIDADLYCNLGSDSNKTEVEKVKKQSRKIYKAVKRIDEYTGRLLLREQ
jgi:CRISPR/Cas system CSM-associated protein Csm2 small subunit|tara:strand:+ start:874 stop:1101 length:228 start_codon:yes stop_codon:yes gene_type:complete